MPRKQPALNVVKNAVTTACRAPSLHNSQPWRWVLQRDGLELHLGSERLTATDRSGREALLSCGAVLDHLRVALAAVGWLTQVERYPNPNDHQHLASIDFSPISFVTEAHRRRADAIMQRRTDRLPFYAPAHWSSLETILRSAVDERSAWIDVVDDEDRPRLAEASHLTEALRQYDSGYHAELAWWTGAYAKSTGIPQSSLVSTTESDPVDIGRSFPVTGHEPERRMSLPDDQSKVLVISAHDDTRPSVLRCGEALSQLLLEATMEGLATCTLTHMIELAASREIVGGLVCRDFPQALVRVGTASSHDDVPAPTLRRRLADVFELHL